MAIWHAVGAVVLRLSGTGIKGATLRVCPERYKAPDRDLDQDPQQALAPVALAVAEIIGLFERKCRTTPDVIT